MDNRIKCEVLSDQQIDGSFFHFVVFGNASPIDAPMKDCIECASEHDAFKLKLIIDNYNKAGL